MTDFIAYDTDLRRPGCALLQAALGCNPRHASLFDTQDWLLAPTPGLKKLPVTQEQLKALPGITEAHRKSTGQVSDH